MEKQLGLPPKPKRPLSPFIQYSQDQRSIILAQNPNISVTDAMKVMAKNWKSVDEAEKAKMKATYSNKMENYTKEMMLYKLSLTDEQKNMFHSARSKLEISEEKNKMKSVIKKSFFIHKFDDTFTYIYFYLLQICLSEIERTWTP